MNSEGVVKLERVSVICPACGRQVEAVASDGRVRGWCSNSRRRVDFVAETQRIGKNPTAETSPISASVKKGGQDPPDEVVRDYLAGDKTIVIQDRYKITPGRMYRILHSANVKLRTDEEMPGLTMTEEG
ncbi:hypothetical protein ES703_85881 [subsurface metagenome]